MVKKYILTWKEFTKELKMSYFELVGYLKKKYGIVKNDYGRGSDSERGLFMHHIMEWWIARLSTPDAREAYPQHQKKERLVYCNWLEHLLLHIKIHQDEKSPRFIYQDTGVTLYLIPELYAYLELGIKKLRCNNMYYKNIDNADALKIFKHMVSLFAVEGKYDNHAILEYIRNAENDAELDGREIYAYVYILTNLPWTKTEEDILRTLYPEKGSKGVEQALLKINSKRTRNAIRQRAIELGITYNDPCLWSKKANNILKKFYKFGSAKVQEKLNKIGEYHTQKSIQHRAQLLHINKTDNIYGWTDEMDNYIIKYYTKYGSSVVQEKLKAELNVNKDTGSIWNRAMKLGIPLQRNIIFDNKRVQRIIEKEYPIGGLTRTKDKLSSCGIIISRDRIKKYIEDHNIKRIFKYMTKTVKHRHVWTKEQDDLIKKYYPKYGKTYIKKIMFNTYGVQLNANTIRRHANSLSIYFDNDNNILFNINKWTNEETNILIKYYNKISVPKMHLKYLPNKSTSAIWHKIDKLRLKGTL